ncbi:MAG: ribonuclease inhibitor [Cytophagales bacterium]|nr:MAG: ribonuclease inhibitor [Cytophagales bacterium]
MISYIGRFHPLFVHLPIGFIAFWLFLEFIAIFRKSDYSNVKSLLILLSALSSIAASVLGYFLSLKTGEYDANILDEHKWQGIWLSVILTIIYFLYTFLKDKKYFNYGYYPSLIVVFILLNVTGHHGGSLTHGSDYLAFSQIKDGEKEAKIEIKDINQAVVFTDLVQPIFKQKCISCHNTEKMKGELLMDTYEHLMKGGESGAVIIATNSAQSELIKLINLEPIEERAMPPKGKVPLTNDEKAVLTWWIHAGATKDKKVAELNPNAAMTMILAKFAGSGNSAHSESIPELPEVSEADVKSVEEIKVKGINIVKIAQNTNMLDVRCIINKQNWNDQKTETLLKIKEQLYILDLSGTVITNKSLASIGKLKSLQTLFLQSTQLNDDNFEALKELENLESLNLYNTQITDKSVETLSQLKKLKKLYVWQTKMTEKGIEQLQKNLPALQIVGEKKYINS